MHAVVEIRNLNPRERAVMEALLRSPYPVSQRELMSRMRDAPSQATMSRVMNGLIGRGLIVKEGETRGARFFLTPDARRVATDPRRRIPIPYDPDRVGLYVPNETRWLPEESAARMRAAVDQAGVQDLQGLDASTYSRAIAERFLVDLAWASSNLEGNSYDHLSTELLIKYGQSASGRDRLRDGHDPEPQSGHFRHDRRGRGSLSRPGRCAPPSRPDDARPDGPGRPGRRPA